MSPSIPSTNYFSSPSIPPPSTGNPNDPQPRVYVYDERGNLKQTVTGLQRLGFPDPVRINPHTRTGFLPVIVEPQHAFLELQSFTY